MDILQIMLIDTQLKYLIGIYTIALILTFALDWQLPGFKQIESFSKNIDLDRYVIKDYMTYWQLTHFLTRFLLGLFCPKYWHIIFAIDFGWETLEWYQWQAHNWYDLIWNMLGLVMGMMIRHYGLFDKYFTSLKAKSNQKDPGVTEPTEDGVVRSSDKRSITHRLVKGESTEPDGVLTSAPNENILSLGVPYLGEGGVDQQANILKNSESGVDTGGGMTSGGDHQVYFSGKNTTGIQVNDGAQLIDMPSKHHRKKKLDKDKISKKDKKKIINTINKSGSDYGCDSNIKITN